MTTNSIIRDGAALAVLALLAVAPASAQTASASAAQSAVGHWLYGADGEIVGSVRGLRDGGRTAVIQYGTILTPGNKLVAISAENVAIVQGHATLRAMTAEAVRSRPAVSAL